MMIMLDRTRYVAAQLLGRTLTDSEIWQAIHKDIARTTRYWRNKPAFEHYVECRQCRVDHGIEHSLVECDVPGREQLWNLAKSLWDRKGHEWPEVSIRSILACGSLKPSWLTGRPRLRIPMLGESL
ncbi:hypothetical protein B0H14DRAFT_3036504 [Mycena olivaceomarginata]|nr:hypothetical protein B0H14DRAFT_3036504 [Mycena olivaceomarginata]